MFFLYVAFILCFGLVFYAYGGYPLLLLLVSAVRKRTVCRKDWTPSVTLIITAHNEETQIAEKIDNSLAIDYPREDLQIIVASDASTDRTDEIVRAYQGRGIELVRVEGRLGKENTQTEAISRSHGEIVVFSDAGTRLETDAVRHMVSNFADATVGCVSSEDKVVGESGQVQPEGLYVRYEMALRRLETRVHSLVGLSGSFFAARRELTEHWPTNLPSDFNTVANSIRRGLRAVSDPKAPGYYRAVPSQGREFWRKVRTVLRGMAAFFSNTDLLNPVRYPFFAFQIISHKLLRWLVPIWLVIGLIVSAVGSFWSPVFLGILLVQVAGYGVAAMGIGSQRLRSFGPIRPLAFFTLVNLSILVAWCRYIRGERTVTWTPSRRSGSQGEPKQVP